MLKQNPSRADMRVVFVFSDFPLDAESTAGCFVFDEAINLIKKGVQLIVFKSSLKPASTKVSGIEVIGPIGARNLSVGLPRQIVLIFRLLKSLFLLGKYAIKHPRRSLYFLKLGYLLAKVASSKEVDIIHAHFAYPVGLIAAIAKVLS